MRKFLFLIVCLCGLAACKEYHASDDPTLRLTFSCDTLRFDTVFSEQGSATLQLKVYNRNASALIIDRVWMDDGSVFRVNIDGEADLSQTHNLPVYGGDSLFVFVRVRMEALSSQSPVLVEDLLHFHCANGASQSVLMEAYGQDVTRIGRAGCGRTVKNGLTLTADLPYIIYDTLIVDGALTVDAGARVHMHQGACLVALGDVTASGTLEQPIVFRGDRIDRLFDSVPYLYAGGGWDGLYLQSDQKRTYQLDYVDILSGNIGLACVGTSASTGSLSTLRMNGCRIHNHTLYGLVLGYVDALVTNTEISNCASYCIYCEGGTHTFVHTTVASYFGYTNIRIQSVAKEDAAAVYIANLSKTEPVTNTSFVNSIITGYLPNQLVVATPLDQYYPGVFVGNYLKTDTLMFPHAQENKYWQKTDTTNVFRQDYYKYKEYIYYDFRLDSLSPAIGIGDSIAALPYPTGRDGVSRAFTRPDAGCYQYQP